MSEDRPVFCHIDFSLPVTERSLFPAFRSTFLFRSSFFYVLLLCESLPRCLPAAFHIGPVFLSAKGSAFSIPSHVKALVPPSGSDAIMFSGVLFVFLLPHSAYLRHSPVCPVFVSLCPGFPDPQPVLWEVFPDADARKNHIPGMGNPLSVPAPGALPARPENSETVSGKLLSAFVLFQWKSYIFPAALSWHYKPLETP